MVFTIQRKSAAGTLSESFGWLQEYPVLLPIFLVVGLVTVIGSLIPLIGLLFVVVQLYFNGIPQLIARDVLAGKSPTITGAAEEMLGRILSLIGVSLISGILIAIGTIFFILPGIYLGLRLSLAPAACVVDNKGAFESLSASWETAQGNLLKILGIGAFVFGIVFLSIVTAVPLAMASSNQEGTMLLVALGFFGIVMAVIGPVVQMAYARIYIENRDTTGGAGAGDEWAGST